MSPAPSFRHQLVCAELFYQLCLQIPPPCRVLFSALDVRLSDEAAAADETIDTAVQPDILVVCDPSKLYDRGCLGAPDLVVETLSPHTAFKDESEKLQLHERHGVRQYWVVNPVAEFVLVVRIG